MTVLNALVDALKREVAVPGTFDATFPNTGRSDLIGTLADAFSQAKLEGGWFGDVVLNTDSTDKTQWSTVPDLSDAGGALIVIYAASRMLRSLLRTAGISGTQRYKAGSVEYETSSSATVIRAELDFLTSRLTDLIAQGTRGARTCSARQVDAYLGQLSGPYVDPEDWRVTGMIGGFFPYEYLA